MRKNKGFTLIELMVVILIVAILAAVLAPMLTGRIRQAKWSEGKAGAGTIATALRAFYAENEGWVTGTGGQTYAGGTGNFALIGITSADLDGKYFSDGNYTVGGLGGVPPAGPVYTITITTPGTIGGTAVWTLDQNGTWVNTAD